MSLLLCPVCAHTVPISVVAALTAPFGVRQAPQSRCQIGWNSGNFWVKEEGQTAPCGLVKWDVKGLPEGSKMAPIARPSRVKPTQSHLKRLTYVPALCGPTQRWFSGLESSLFATESLNSVFLFFSSLKNLPLSSFPPPKSQYVFTKDS